jgi:hypothetical protein
MSGTTMKSVPVRLVPLGVALILLSGAPGAVAQSYLGDVGYTALQRLLGAAIPTGAGVNVMQIEASLVSSTDPGYPIYAPDVSSPMFAGKSFSFPGAPSTTVSSHATSVGGIFYGADSIASGITSIAVYNAADWLQGIDTASAAAPVNGSRVANDSWVGSGGTAADTGIILRLVDRETQLDQLIQVVGMPYDSSPLLASAYNVISVGETAGLNSYGTQAVDSVYVAGRSAPDIVAPMSTTSDATPVVAAAAALLVGVAHTAGAALSTGSTYVSGVGTLYDAEQAVTIKAALMAGADRVTNNASTTANITDYGTNGHLTGNGLDDRYGAGQLDVLNSYQIIAAGEQHSMEGGSISGGYIRAQGFDYVAAFGGSGGSNTTATYKFNATANSELAACLTWNIGVANNATLATTLHHLALELYDVTTHSVVASSASGVDNTQNLWVNLVAGDSYDMLVQSNESGNFSWPYALAWNITPAPVPLPATGWLLLSALGSVGLLARGAQVRG